jgi:hypothetical protein
MRLPPETRLISVLVNGTEIDAPAVEIGGAGSRSARTPLRWRTGCRSARVPPVRLGFRHDRTDVAESI